MTIFCKKLSTLIQICCDIMDFLFINKLNLTDFNIQLNRKDFIYGLVNKSHVRNFKNKSANKKSVITKKVILGINKSAITLT